jgi:hypothetical protein
MDGVYQVPKMRATCKSGKTQVEEFEASRPSTACMTHQRFDGTRALALPLW